MDQNLNTLTNMKIEDIDVSKISDGKYKCKFEMFPVSAEVDVVSGATFSSKVILKAIENALKNK